MIRRPPRSTPLYSSAASDVYKRQEWQLGGQSIGGMMEIRPEMGPVPPNWLPYFMVEDCDVVANKAAATGGKLNVPPTDIPNVGRFSVIQDPQGAMFAIIKLTDHAK